MIYERKGSLTAAYGSEEALVQHQQAKRPPLVLKSNVGRRNLDGHRLLFAACACLAGASLFGLLSVIVWTHHDKAQVTLEHDTQHTDPSSTSNHDKWSPSAVVLGPPTDSFRDNLRNDTQYITSWPSAGWTNDVMTYANLIYLARLTGRVPVIPTFIPSHVRGDAGPIPFGEIFNTTRLGEAIGIPVIEWQDIKAPSSNYVDEIGCWSIWQATREDDSPRGSAMISQLNLDISYTKAPQWAKLNPDDENENHAAFWSLATLGFPDHDLIPPRPSELHNALLPPDEQMLCFDYMYYVGAYKPFEYQYDYRPAWKFAAQYMRWTAWLEEVSEWYIRLALEVEIGALVPPYISIHVRHYDFQSYCGDIPLSDCFAPIPVIARRVAEVQKEVQEKTGIDVTHVIMTSDERDPVWWGEVYKQGWKTPNHTHTGEDYGEWYPVFIDAVIQSNGVGFVGTDRSTMSEMAKLRCETWHKGSTRMVRWGHIGADDH
ncbi:hypothetical protein FIBSPDRAFT_764866 [Athelia psychrophila]|uniref:Uncharacterized protein n=1 Tax=Athelia psychrophila TaxID=1759441 RepID=A0A167WIS2_9AGAM|nr:hypothetical protein FIBSPDRAFT_764866 [Fibularhizoctonia sp. CBS 109695]